MFFLKEIFSFINSAITLLLKRLCVNLNSVHSSHSFFLGVKIFVDHIYASFRPSLHLYMCARTKTHWNVKHVLLLATANMKHTLTELRNDASLSIPLSNPKSSLVELVKVWRKVLNFFVPFLRINLYNS